VDWFETKEGAEEAAAAAAAAGAHGVEMREVMYGTFVSS